VRRLWLDEAWGPHLEPGLCNLSVLDLVDGNHIYLSRTVWKAACDRLVIDHHVGNGYPLEQPAVQVGFLEPSRMTRADFCRSPRQEAIGELIILTVLGPPRHEGIDVAGVIGVKLLLDGELGVDGVAGIHRGLSKCENPRDGCRGG
jgi:hypothetical protein